MRFIRIRIKNFKSIENLELKDIEDALILVGKNNTGKTSVMDAVRTMTGARRARPEDFDETYKNIEIEVELELTAEDLAAFHSRGAVSAYKRYALWEQEVRRRLPSFKGNVLSFTCIINRDGTRRLSDGFKKHNKYIDEMMPRIHYIDTDRDMEQLQRDLLLSQAREMRKEARTGSCIFDGAKTCRHCFQCIGLINQKRPGELSLMETSRLMEYKMNQLNLERFSRRLNDNFRKNGGLEEIIYSLNWNPEEIFKVKAQVYSGDRGRTGAVDSLSRGMKSIYMLSLLETYSEEENELPSIIMVEYPEMFLHPQLQKVASEILYRLSKKNQVIFSTHAPNLIFNFNSRQIRQVILDEHHRPAIRERTDLSDERELRVLRGGKTGQEPPAAASGEILFRGLRRERSALPDFHYHHQQLHQHKNLRQLEIHQSALHQGPVSDDPRRRWQGRGGVKKAALPLLRRAGQGRHRPPAAGAGGKCADSEILFV